MWLDELNDLVVEFSTKIDQHREILQKSESSTRYCLIDPLLTALGWDLSDPSQVLTEYNSGKGRADYALFPRSGPPSLVVEAKPLFTPTENAVEQTINYCIQDGIDYFAITNGDNWEVYETHKKGQLQDKQVTAFKITDMNQSAVMGMLWLWRGNFNEGDPVMPVTHKTEDVTDTSEEDHETESGVNSRSGVSLSELDAGTGRNPPQTVKFSDGVTKPVGKWNRVQIATVEWLVETGRVNEFHCPLTNRRGTHLVHITPHRRDGKQISERVQIGRFWIDVGLDAKGQVRRAIDILNAANADPSKVFVTF